MPRPRQSDYMVPRGGAGGVVTYDLDRLAYAKAMQDFRDQEFEAAYGFPRSALRANQAAQGQAQQEWETLVDELYGGMDEIRGGRLSREVEDFYRRQAAGELSPFDTEAQGALVSAATDPVLAAARNAVDQARSSFAARGLSRSGMLADLENRYLTQGATQAAMQGAQLRSDLQAQNFASRERGGAGLASHYTSRESMLNSLRQQLANLRAQREFTPGQFVGKSSTTRGGYLPEGVDYKPPMSAGQTGSAPRFGTFGRSNVNQRRA